ncbi:MAG: lipoyl synthase [Pseudanabaenaceae cyanobacterium]
MTSRFPLWLRSALGSSVGRASAVSTVQRLVKTQNIATICEEGRCPNRGECYRQGTATFLLMGTACTRHCGFCDVTQGQPPQALDPHEPQRIAEAVATLGLRYVVLTSVARDDLPDGGAGHFQQTMAAVGARCPDTQIEVLVPDFGGRLASVDTVVAAGPVCFNHNLETVARLQGPVRRGDKYERSLAVLARAAQQAPGLPIKSGLMLGLGETPSELLQTLQDLRAVGCTVLTLGQYLQPARDRLPVVRYVPPAEFQDWAETARELGFARVYAGPLVRSSYHAAEQVLGGAKQGYTLPLLDGPRSQ